MTGILHTFSLLCLHFSQDGTGGSYIHLHGALSQFVIAHSTWIHRDRFWRPAAPKNLFSVLSQFLDLRVHEFERHIIRSVEFVHLEMIFREANTVMTVDASALFVYYLDIGQEVLKTKRIS